MSGGREPAPAAPAAAAEQLPVDGAVLTAYLQRIAGLCAGYASTVLRCSVGAALEPSRMAGSREWLVRLEFEIGGVTFRPVSAIRNRRSKGGLAAGALWETIRTCNEFLERSGR